ncbi:hypothetical protein ACJMK2_003632 [Sinanodonta woodiana]|uniref:CCHC-type domain-containing protein n=1 Tax=Sinanodonta woodiana TaxID=1069815 RepID=A0ABD3Y214_SINWO
MKQESLKSKGSNSAQRANFLHGFLTTTWYKGCIYHRKCNKCGETGYTPSKCPNDRNLTIATNVPAKEITISKQSLSQARNETKSNKELVLEVLEGNDQHDKKEINLEKHFNKSTRNETKEEK